MACTMLTSTCFALSWDATLGILGHFTCVIIAIAIRAVRPFLVSLSASLGHLNAGSASSSLELESLSPVQSSSLYSRYFLPRNVIALVT